MAAGIKYIDLTLALPEQRRFEFFVKSGRAKQLRWNESEGPTNSLPSELFE